MEKFRKYGNEPFSVVVSHGGPGAPGYMKPVAEKLSEICGVIEPFQSAGNIDGQVDELKNIIKSNCTIPVTLIGHSYGAWLSVVFAYEYPGYVKKVILLNSGPFEDEYAKQINETRNSRLSEKDLGELDKLRIELNNKSNPDRKEIFKKFGELSSKGDYYKRIDFSNDVVDYQPEVFQTVMLEAMYLRKSGKLMRMAGKLDCPVIAINGDFDPHPYKGIEEPLSKVIKNFRFILLEKCGHYPWNEFFARDKFYDILKNDILFSE